MELNPIAELRQLVGISQTAFAVEADVSRQTIVNLEAGMYEEIPLKVHRTLTDLVHEAGFPPQRVLRGHSLGHVYRRWQTLKREQTDLGDWPPLSLEEIVARFPSPGGFCRALCIPTTALHHGLTRHGVPEIIQTALTEAGYGYANWELE